MQPTSNPGWSDPPERIQLRLDLDLALKLGALIRDNEDPQIKALGHTLLAQSPMLRKLAEMLEQSMVQDGMLPLKIPYKSRLSKWARKTGCKAKVWQPGDGHGPDEEGFVAVNVKGIKIQVREESVDKLLVLGIP